MSTPPRRHRTARTTRRSHLALVDLLDESLAGLLARPSRMVLTAAGTVLGITALVAITSLTTTAGNTIVSRLDALAATEVVVTPADAAADQPSVNVLPWDAETRLAPLNGVVASGTLSPVEIEDQRIATRPGTDPRSEHLVDVFAASPGLLAAVRGNVGHGRWFDQGHDQRGDSVAVAGRAAADRLQLSSLDARPAIFIGDTALTVIGVLTDTQREPHLLNAIIIPDGTARALFGLPGPASIHIDTQTAAAGVVGSQAALALAPHAPDQLTVRVPPEPREVRAQVAGDVRALFLILGAISLLIGGLGIANTTLVGVLERTTEIGLRRSLGAYRSHIAAQFLLESATIGILGGLVGASLGILTTIVVSAIQQWTPVLEPWVPLAALGTGALLGLAAGTYPAWRAANIQPIAALRSEV